MTKTVKIYSAHAVTLRIDEMVEGEMGIKAAKQVGQIDLAAGDNNVDAELWERWIGSNKANPLVATGAISHQTEEQPDGERSSQESREAGEDPHRVQ